MPTVPQCPGLIRTRSEEHTSELQSQSNLVCRLLLEKKKNETLPTLTSLTNFLSCFERYFHQTRHIEAAARQQSLRCQFAPLITCSLLSDIARCGMH